MGTRNLRKAWMWLIPIATIAAALAICEVVVRWAMPQESAPLLASLGEEAHVRDDRYGWKLRPGYKGPFAYGSTLAVNSLGLRDVEYGPKERGEIRILSLGDSNAFGWGVDLPDSFIKVVEKRLRQEFATSKISVVNAAVTGYSTRQELLALADLYDVVRPDAVIVTFTATNDVHDNHVFEGRVRQGIQTPLGPVTGRSHLARLVLKSAWPAVFFAANRSDASVQETLALLDQLQAEAKRRNLPLLMLMMPPRAEISPSARWQTRVLRTLGLGGWVSRPRSTVIAHWSARSVDHVDLLPSLADASRKADVFLRGDPHLNPAGNRVIADAVYGRVREMVARLRHPAPLAGSTRH